MFKNHSDYYLTTKMNTFKEILGIYFIFCFIIFLKSEHPLLCSDTSVFLRLVASVEMKLLSFGSLNNYICIINGIVGFA